MKKKILVIGWDAADWRVIHPLIDQGKMPAMERMVTEGVIGNLATLQPILSPMLWTSIATGMRPFKHGVLGFSEPTPDGQAVRPVSGASRKVKAIWNILSQEGYRSNVVGWWPSHPAEPINGTMVSNSYHRAIGGLDDPWPMASGTVHPPRMAEALAELRFHPHEVAKDQAAHFLPNIEKMDIEKDKRVLGLLKTFAECTSIHACASYLMENEPWDFMGVYYDAIDHFCHGFMKYHPPKKEGVSEEDFENYNKVVETGYIYHDLMLQTLLQLAGPETTVILVSDHGFHPDQRRPDSIPDEPAGPAVEHRDYGIFAMMGPGIKKDVQIYGATLLDITPTVLATLELPVGEDMDGKVLSDVFEETREIKTIPSWDSVAGDAGMLPEDAKMDPLAAQEALDQLVALGYIEKPDGDIEKAVANTARELRYNLGRSYMDGHRHRQATPLFEDLFERYPDEFRFGAQLAICYRAEERIDEMRVLVEKMNVDRQQAAVEAREKLAEWREILKTRSNDREENKASEVAEGKDRAGEDSLPDEEDPLLDEEERQEIRKLRTRAQVDLPGLAYFMGFVEMADGNDEKALEYLENAAKAQPRRTGLLLQIGEAYLGLERWDEAEAAYQRAAEVDDESAFVQLGFARVALGRKENPRAAEYALASIGLLFQHPMSHYVLGVALHRMGRLPRSVQALQTAVSLNPNFIEAYELLAAIHEEQLKDPKKAQEYRDLAEDIRNSERENVARPAFVEDPHQSLPDRISTELKAQTLILPEDAEPFLTVVSGLPRSGTSMMMRMLNASGMEMMTDGNRQADENNPKGYYELEAVKRTKQDSGWLEGSDGKAVKIIHLLLQQLPPDRKYRVLMMQRDLDEVVASQEAMLQRNDPQAGNPGREPMKEVFSKQLNQIQRVLIRHPSFAVLNVSYNEIVNGSEEEIQKVIDFLGLKCSPEAMSCEVDSKLYRQRGLAAQVDS